MVSGQSYKWDFFISHASEDKPLIVEPLAQTLNALGFRVWYDTFTLKMGDSLNQSINNGLTESRFGIVVLSPNFFAKNWPKRELDALVSQETIFGELRILPIWHDIDSKSLVNYSPTLVDKKGILSSNGVVNIIREIIRAVEGKMMFPDFFPKPPYDFLWFDDLEFAFKKLAEFVDKKFTEDEIQQLYQTLFIHDVRSREKLGEFVSSVKVMETLRKVYDEELSRPLTPFDVVNSGCYLFNMGCTETAISFVRNELRKTEEYRKLHPNSNVPPNLSLDLPRIQDGKKFADLISLSHSRSFDYATPNNEQEVDAIADFSESIELLGELVFDGEQSDVIRQSFELTRIINRLEELQYFVYADVKSGSSKVGEKIFTGWNQLYIVLSRKELNTLIVIVRPTN